MLSVKVTTPGSEPFEVGVKLTLMVQVFPTATLAPQLWVSE